MIEETINWYNGEIFEGKFIIGFGVLLIISALLFYYLGSTPAPKALLIPFLVIGCIFSAIGSNMVYSNTQKIPQAQSSFSQNEKQFITSEIKRVQDFQYLYPLSIAISLGCFLIANGLLYFVKNIHGQAIAISLILFGMAFATIDYFSKERATIYYQQLVQNNHE